MTRLEPTALPLALCLVWDWGAPAPPPRQNIARTPNATAPRGLEPADGQRSRLLRRSQQGNDAQNGRRQRLENRPSSVKQLKPGDTLYLRGGTTPRASP